MYNGSTDEEQLKKDPEKYAIWRLEQMINFGIGKDKIKEGAVEINHQRVETIGYPLKLGIEYQIRVGKKFARVLIKK